jgi:catechol 2,3-dioxygenase-like lactoylglutathione lyase family enzyme
LVRDGNALCVPVLVRAAGNLGSDARVRFAAVGLELYMVGVIVADMRRAIEFYRRLGVAIPDGSEAREHVEVKMGELTFFLTTIAGNARWDPARREVSGDGYRVILEFYVETAAAVDAKYAELTGFGYTGHCAPYDVTPSMRFAMVDDPDGNTILLSGMTETGAAADAGDP